MRAVTQHVYPFRLTSLAAPILRRGPILHKVHHTRGPKDSRLGNGSLAMSTGGLR